MLRGRFLLAWTVLAVSLAVGYRLDRTETHLATGTDLPWWFLLGWIGWGLTWGLTAALAWRRRLARRWERADQTSTLVLLLATGAFYGLTLGLLVEPLVLHHRQQRHRRHRNR